MCYVDLQLPKPSWSPEASIPELVYCTRERGIVLPGFLMSVLGQPWDREDEYPQEGKQHFPVIHIPKPV